MAYRPSMDLVEGVREGWIGPVARLISRAEAGYEECRPAVEAVYQHTGRAAIVGVTGVPGSGKSTLLCELVRAARRTGRTVAVVAIDPTSPFSGGAILGDRIRMNDLTGDEGVFIRSMSTRGALGGLARASIDAIDILDAAGFDIVFVETVGVGQDEVDIAGAAHTTVVVSAPGLGDDIQAIKAGVLEIADIHVVSKCDRPDASRTVKELRSMLTLSPRDNQHWRPPVIATSARTGEGIEELLEAIDRHGSSLRESGEIRTRQRRIAERRVVKYAEEMVRDAFATRRQNALDGLMEAVVERRLHPRSAALQVVAAANEEA